MPDPITLIAIHGNGGGGFRFSRVPDHLPAGVRLVAPTLPGFGGTPRDPALQTLADYGRVVADHVAAQPRPRVLLGTGIGGTFAIEAVQQGIDLDGLILHAPVGTRLETRWFPRLMRLPGMTTLGRTLLSAPPLRPLWRRRLFTRPIPDADARRFFDGYAQCAAFGQMFSIITADWFANLQPMIVPAALLWGEQERILPLDQLDDYRALLPNHVVRTVPGWDHFPTLDRPADFARVVTELARRLIAWERDHGA